MGEGADWVMKVWFDERSRSVVMKTLSEGWDRQLYYVIKRVVFQIEYQSFPSKGPFDCTL